MFFGGLETMSIESVSPPSPHAADRGHDSHTGGSSNRDRRGRGDDSEREDQRTESIPRLVHDEGSDEDSASPTGNLPFEHGIQGRAGSVISVGNPVGCRDPMNVKRMGQMR